MVLNQKIVWKPPICSLFLEKVYLRFHENWHEISWKIVYERIKHLEPEVQTKASLRKETEILTHSYCTPIPME